MENGLVCSRDLNSVKLPRSGAVIKLITIDMTGWTDNVHPDISAVDQGTYPYRIMFRDSSNKAVHVMSSEMKASGMKTLLECAESRGIYPQAGTQVEIICPVDYVKEYEVSGVQPYGTRFRCGLEQFNDYGLDALPFKPKDGVCEQRLESVLDQVVHTWSANETTRDARRFAPFTKSIYHYHDIDNDRINGVLSKQGSSDFDSLLGR